MHPPLIGYADDGISIYGRYLSVAAPGYTTALDVCGGHVHDNYAYHYHTQIISALSSGQGAGTSTVGLAYPQSSVGVLYCFRGNLSADPYYGSSGGLAVQPCCSSTNYYAAPGFALSITSGGTTPSGTQTVAPSPAAVVATQSSADLSGLSAGAIAGIVIGAVSAVGALIAVAVWLSFAAKSPPPPTPVLSSAVPAKGAGSLTRTGDHAINPGLTRAVV